VGGGEQEDAVGFRGGRKKLKGANNELI